MSKEMKLDRTIDTGDRELPTFQELAQIASTIPGWYDQPAMAVERAMDLCYAAAQKLRSEKSGKEDVADVAEELGRALSLAEPFAAWLKERNLAPSLRLSELIRGTGKEKEKDGMSRPERAANILSQRLAEYHPTSSVEIFLHNVMPALLAIDSIPNVDLHGEESMQHLCDLMVSVHGHPEVFHEITELIERNKWRDHT